MTIPPTPQLNATISTDSPITRIEHNHVWTDDGGTTHATVRLGHATLFFDGDGQTARELAEACTAAAEAMDAEIKRAAEAGTAGAK